MALFVDLDGVLADFDTHYENMFGVRPCKVCNNVDWSLIRNCTDFYLHIPPMPDFSLLWDYVSRYNPIILTGIPKSIPEAAANKKEWVRMLCGPDVPVITTESWMKCQHAMPGDILIDDWEKYRHRWENVGGVWITHYNAKMTILQLKEIGL